MSVPSAHASVTISASCADVYALTTDLPTMATLAEEATAMTWSKGHATGRPGAVFKGHDTNRGKSCTTRCTVTEQTWDRRPGWIRKPAEMTTGVGDRTSENAKNIALTLERLKARAEG
jgi:hypothetical protein